MEKRSEEEQSLENEDDSYDGIDVPRYRSFNYDELLSGQAEILEADDDSNQRASESFDCDDLREHQFRSVTIGQHRYEGDDFASTSSLVSNLQPKQSTAGAVGLRAEHFAVSQKVGVNLGPVPPLPKPYPLSTTSYDIEGKIPSKEVYKRIMESFRKNDVDCRFIPQEWRFESLAYPGGRAVSFYCQVFKRTANVHVIEFQKTNGCGWSFSCLLDQINEDLEELYGEEDAPMHQGKAAMGRAGMPGVPGLTRSSASIPTYADEPVSIALTDADVAPIVDFIRGPDLESQRMGMEIMVDICNQPSAGALLRKHGAVVAVVAVANSTKDVELRRLAAAAMCNFVRRNKDINTLLQSELECVPLMLKLARECAGGLPLLEVQREACRALGALANRPDTRNVLLQHGGEKCFHDLMSEGGTTCPRLRQLAMDGYQSIKRMPSY